MKQKVCLISKKILTLLLVFVLSTFVVPQELSKSSETFESEPTAYRGMYGLTAKFYDEPHLEDFVVAKRYKTPINFFFSDFGGTWPYEPLKLTPELADGSTYSVLWTGKLYVPENGYYSFRLSRVDDGGYVMIGGKLITDRSWTDPDIKGTPQTVYLKAGDHDLVIAYEQRIHYIASYCVKWSGPSFSEEVIPITSRQRMFYAATHVHSTYSDGTSEVGELIKMCCELFGEFGGVLAITDHISEESVLVPWTDPDFKTINEVNPVRAEEWGYVSYTKPPKTGHATIFNIDNTSDAPILVKDAEADADGNATEATYNTMLTEAQDRGALVWANHPKTDIFIWAPGFASLTRDDNNDGDYYDAGDWVYGIEGRMIGTEVWNAEEVEYWQKLLATGFRKFVGIAASDFHFKTWVTALDAPISMVLAECNHPDDMAEAIAAGRVTMVKNCSAPYLILSADNDDDGTDDTWMGDTIYVAGSGASIKSGIIIEDESTPITFVATLSECPPESELHFITSSGLVETIPCSRNADAKYLRYSFTRTFLPSDKDFVRVELWQGSTKLSMTNPIYINID